MLHTLAKNPLDYTVSYLPVYDAVRVFVIFVAVAIMVRVGFMKLSGESAQSNRATKSVMLVYAIMAVYLVLQEFQQLGEDVVIWRLPLLALLGSSALVTLFSAQQVRGTQVNRTTSLYLVTRAAVEDALCDRDRLSGKLCSNKEHTHGV